MPIDRRGLLLAGAAVGGGLVVGVVGERAGWWEADLLGASDPNAAIRRLARSSEATLIRAYDAALATGATDPRLELYRAQHADHLEALGGSDAEIDSAAPVAVDPAALGEQLAAMESAWQTDAATGVRISPDGDLARLLALITASEASHVQGWSNV